MLAPHDSNYLKERKEKYMTKYKNSTRLSILILVTLVTILCQHQIVDAKTMYNLETDSFENKQKLTVLNNWMKNDSTGNGRMPGRGIPGLWSNAFSVQPVEGKLYLASELNAKKEKNVTIKNYIATAFSNDSESEMLILPPGADMPDQVIETASEYALYTPGNELTTKVTGRNEDNTAEMEITATSSNVAIKVTRLKADANSPENGQLNTKFSFPNVKSVMNVQLGLYLNKNTGSGHYSGMPKDAYYYSMTNVKVDMSKYVAPNKTSLYLTDNEVEIYAGDKWDPSKYFERATNIDGNTLKYSQLSNVEDNVNPNKQGDYKVVYKNDTIQKELLVHVISPLSLEVPTKVDFGSYKLGTENKLLSWSQEHKVVVESYLNSSWQLTAKLINYTDGFQNYVMNGNEKLINNQLITSSSGKGNTNITTNWNGKNGIHVDYSNVQNIRSDKGSIEWTLSPSVLEAKE